MTKHTAVVFLIPLLALFVAHPLAGRAQNPVPDRSLIAATDRDEARDPGFDSAGPLREFLSGTKWLMYGRSDRVLEFREDGTCALSDWARQGIQATWRVTGRNQVKVTVTSDRFNGLFAVFNFDEDRASFTGHDLNEDRQITRSPRAPWQQSRQLAEAVGESNSALPEGVVPLTKEQLISKVPQFYSFDYHANPQPGKRYWLRVNNETWIERYPDGLQSTFRVLGHMTVKDTEGTLVVKVAGDRRRTGTNNVGGLEAFIPDKGSAVMHHWYRNTERGDTDWNDLGVMLGVE